MEGRVAVGGAPLCLPPASELRRRLNDAEDYAFALERFVPRSIVIDGEWNEQGEMGWFGLSDESDDAEREWSLGFHERFIRDLDPAKPVIIGDFHIKYSFLPPPQRAGAAGHERSNSSR